MSHSTRVAPGRFVFLDEIAANPADYLGQSVRLSGKYVLLSLSLSLSLSVCVCVYVCVK